MENTQQEESSDSQIDRSPFFCNRQLDDSEIAKSPALRGIQAMLYDRPPIEVQATHRTQGNNYMREALDGSKPSEQRQAALESAFQCYSTAIDVKVEPDTPGADEALSVIYSNRSEVLRLMQRFSAAFYDADKAEKLDAKNFKALVRKAKVCEDLEDFARAVVYWKYCWELTYKPDVYTALTSARIKLQQTENALCTIFSVVYNAFAGAPTAGPLAIGRSLDFLPLQQAQIIDSYTNGVTVYLINQETRTIDVLQNCDVRAPLGPPCKAAGVRKLTYIQNWTDPLVNRKLKLVSASSEHKMIEAPFDVPLSKVVTSNDYIIPAVVAFFAEWVK